MTNVTFSVTAYQSAFLLVSSATITLAAAARAISPLNLPFHRVGRRRPLASLHAKGGARSRRHPQFFRRRHGAQRAKIIKKVHKPPRNHYIECCVFYDIGLNCESQGEIGRTCKKYKIIIGFQVSIFFLYMLSLFHRASARVQREVCEPFRQSWSSVSHAFNYNLP